MTADGPKSYAVSAGMTVIVPLPNAHVPKAIVDAIAFHQGHCLSGGRGSFLLARPLR